MEDPPRAQVLLLLAFALIVNLVRAPGEILHGRVYAEEATTYLRYAWNASPFQAFVAPHLGYYSLLDNVVTLIQARLLPLSAAAFLFVGVALSVRMLTAYLLVSCRYLTTFTARLVTLCAFLFATGSLEGWLSLEYSHFCIPVCVALILISPEDVSRSTAASVLRLLFLLGAGLTGVTSCFLLPLFWWKFFRRRNRPALLQAAVLSFAAAIQLAAVVTALRSGDTHGFGSRPLLIGPVLLERVLLMPILSGRSVLYTNYLFSNHLGAFIPFGWVVFAAGIALLVVLGLATTRVSVFLVTAALLSATISWFGCVQCSDPALFTASPVTADRYFYTANVLLALAVSFMFFGTANRRLRVLSGSVLSLILLSGIVQYPRGITRLGSYGQSWVPQVAMWKRDVHTPIQVYNVIPPTIWPEELLLPRTHANASLPFWIFDFTRRKERKEICQACAEGKPSPLSPAVPDTTYRNICTVACSANE